MKLTLESRNRHLIRGYDAGEVRIADQCIRHNCLISAEQIVPWNAAAELKLDDISPVLAMNPEVVVLGMSNSKQHPSAAIYAAFLERGIGFEVMDIGAACRTFNILLGEHRRIVAALLLQEPK
jgi:uncharacterized protein